MFVRVKTTPNSPRRSVQVVESMRDGVRVKQKIVRYMGIALDDGEEAKLKAMAQEYIQRSEAEQLSQSSLFETQPQQVKLRKRGRPKRSDFPEVPVDKVRLVDWVEESRRIEGPEEVLGGLYDYLGFHRILPGKHANALLRDLVIARIMEPSSKRRTQRQLFERMGRHHHLDAVYRLLDKVEEHLPQLKQRVLQSTASLTQGRVDLLLFDVTTLYFESVETDGLREFGYSKDQKYHCTQVVLALATNEDGLPIGYELFPGNTAEVSTLLASIDTWRQQLAMDRITFVADRALCARKNLAALETSGAHYVVAMPLRRSLKAAEAAQVREAKDYTLCSVDNHLMWVREFDHEGKRLIVTYSSTRARKDAADRQAILDRLDKLLSVPDPSKRLIKNKGYLKYIETKGKPGVIVLNEAKVAQEAAWDGLHAIITNDFETPAADLLARYRRLWVIEESFRINKHNLAVRPIYHFKPERIKAHIGLCFLAFALLRQALQRIRLAQKAISPNDLRDTLMSVQATIFRHKSNGARFHTPSRFTHAAACVYRAFGIKRCLDSTVFRS